MNGVLTFSAWSKVGVLFVFLFVMFAVMQDSYFRDIENSCKDNEYVVVFETEKYTVSECKNNVKVEDKLAS